MAPVTLEGPLADLSYDARIYPVHLLEGCQTGLCLFAAAFLGVNDAIHLARMQMVGTCVDIDGPRLREMELRYPDDWEFVHSDAWVYAKWARDSGLCWDVVSVDTWTGELTDKSLKSLPLWCSIANRAVLVTVTKKSLWKVPDGWESSRMERSELADWLVLTRG